MPSIDQPPQGAVAQPGADIAEPAEETGLWRSIVRWSTRAAVAGAVLSLLIHAAALALAAILTVHYPGADAGGEHAGDAVEFAMMTESELASILDQADEPARPVVPESLTPIDPAATALQDAAPVTSDLTSDTDLDVELDAGAGDVGETGEGVVTGAGGGGASFFGLEAQGSRFAYIVDRSSSMRGEKMARTRSELIESVDALTENGEFLIVFYSDRPEALGGRPRWRDASERSKAEARRLIMSVMPMGGTKPLPAFEMVFERRIKPDAIYFMTDGKFNDSVPERIAAMNRRYRIPIHCILFGEPSTNGAVAQEVRDMMREIAKASGGRFRQVEVKP